MASLRLCLIYLNPTTEEVKALGRGLFGSGDFGLGAVLNALVDGLESGGFGLGPRARYPRQGGFCPACMVRAVHKLERGASEGLCVPSLCGLSFGGALLRMRLCVSNIGQKLEKA